MGNHIPSSALPATNWNVNTTLNTILLKVFIDWCFGFDLSKCEPNVLNKLKKQLLIFDHNHHTISYRKQHISYPIIQMYLFIELLYY